MPTASRAAPVAAVLAGLDGIRGWQEDYYRDLHAHPELSHAEHRTAAGVADRLRGVGFEVHEGIGGTGVVGILRNGDGPTVLLRADMDALPVKEATRPAVRQHRHGHRRRRQRRPGDARLRARHPRHLPARRRPAARRRRQPLERHPGRAVPAGRGNRRRGAGHGRRRARPDRPRRRRRVGAARPARAGRKDRHPPRPGAVRRRQHAHHRPRPWWPRLDAAGDRRPGGPGGDDRGPAADRRLP